MFVLAEEIPQLKAAMGVTIAWKNEKIWLNQYHRRVRDTLSKLVDEDARDWLIEATTRI